MQQAAVAPRIAVTTPAGEPPIVLGREICGDLRLAEEREWLVTNGIGGFASGTVAGVLTRRYHGLLVAALDPPLGRTLLAAKLDEELLYDGQTYPLYTNRWAGGAIAPDASGQIECFRLENGIPSWTFAAADALIEKRIVMAHSENTTVLEYRLLRASAPVRLTIKALVNYRDFHELNRAGENDYAIEPIPSGLRIQAHESATPLYVMSNAGSIDPAHSWYRGFSLLEERRRGMDNQEDHLHTATLAVDLQPDMVWRIVLSTREGPADDWSNVFEAAAERAQNLQARFTAHLPAGSHPPAWIRQLAVAADQFLGKRAVPDLVEGRSILAGYPWFDDWGRDIGIALPGLALATGRHDDARSLIRTASRYINGGMLPNQLPGSGNPPTFNSADAALWFIDAIRQYSDATHDNALIEEVWPKLLEIGEAYANGARYGIQADPADGLLRAGEPGIQLTWMDAKISDWVVTPRQGKPIELSALWLNATVTLGQFARLLGQPHQPWDELAGKTRAGFQRFWNEETGYCFDVLDGPEGDDPALRPNQVIALSLPECALSEERQRRIVEIVMRRLLTPYGLRSLAPDDSAYVGRYQGDALSRDSAYHQGAAWVWLIGPFLLAHLRAFRDPQAARKFLQPFRTHLTTRGLGTVSELFDGDPPYQPRGAVAQAWSVAEILRAWTAIEELTAVPV